MAKHYDEDGDHIADRGEYELCDDRPRDGNGDLTAGLPVPDDVEWSA